MQTLQAQVILIIHSIITEIRSDISVQVKSRWNIRESDYHLDIRGSSISDKFIIMNGTSNDPLFVV